MFFVNAASELLTDIEISIVSFSHVNVREMNANDSVPAIRIRYAAYLMLLHYVTLTGVYTDNCITVRYHKISFYQLHFLTLAVSDQD